MEIGQRDTTTLPALRMVRLMADEARRELGSNADRGTTARPTVKQLNNTLDRLAGIVKLMDEVVLPVFDLPPIPHATDTEKRIVGKLVQDALAAGYSLSVWDGEEMTVVESTDADEIYKALGSTDSDTLYIHIRETDPPGVMLIWGNGVDVISDYNTSLETVLAGANNLAVELDR